ncbi:polar amino acid transport system substrate-binding protein [Peribacillus cavernae]|nr:polar amino acid transport system substrate-binding protein [Peribacillus cavernae]
MIVKKFTGAFWLLPFIIFTLGISMFGVSPAFAEKKTYRVAGEWALPPFSYTKEDGTLTGISIDLMEKVAIENGLRFEYVPMRIGEAETALQNGTVDAIAGITYSTEKERRFDFSDPYFTMSDSLIIPKEKKDSIHGMTDVRDLQVVLENRTPALATLLNMRNTNLTLATNQYTGLLTLIQGRADVLIGNKWTSTVYLKHLKQKGNFIILDEVIEPADYAIAVKEGNEDLLRMIDGTLTNMKAKGEVNTLIDKWVKLQPEAEIARLKQFIFLLTIVLMGAALVLFFIYVWNQRLKKAVSLQTRKLQVLNKDLQDQQQRIADSSILKDQILNHIDTGIVTFDLNYTMTSCNAKAYAMLGLSADMSLKYQHSSLLERLFRHYTVEHELQEESAVPLIFEINDNGQKKVIYYHMLLMYDSQVKQTGYLLSMNDETEKKKLEQKLITQEKLHALGQLVAGVAHEIRNPLTSIKTFIDLLPSKYDRPGFRDMIIEHVPAEVNRLNTIVTDLIDYARPRPPNKQSCSADELTSLLSFLQVTIEKKHIIVEQTFDKNLFFYIDPQQIRQVLLNLILNAIDAVEETVEKKITISIEKENEDTGRIIIADTGKGIRKEELNRIFEPFYTGKEQGVGLGLTLSFKLIKENNGDIHVNSRTGQGTTFIVLLPMYKEAIGNEATHSSH